MLEWLDALDERGYAILPGVISPEQIRSILTDFNAAMARAPDAEGIRSEAGRIYAVRNVLSLWPGAATAWQAGSLPAILKEILGPDFGLVRVLYFDKPPERTWALPWHKDQTIAVRERSEATPNFHHPTVKCGIPHVEAPVEVLERMLTVRLHLDSATEANGPLKVIPGSHRTGKDLVLDETRPVTILTNVGDALLMRPLLTHCSNKSHAGCSLHRRVLHLEFAANRELDEGWEWHDFVRPA